MIGYPWMEDECPVLADEAWLKQWWIFWYESESIGFSILSIIWKPGRYTENLWWNTPQIWYTSWVLLLWNCKSTWINLDMGKILKNTVFQLLVWFIKDNKRTLCSSRRSWIFRANSSDPWICQKHCIGTSRWIIARSSKPSIRRVGTGTTFLRKRVTAVVTLPVVVCIFISRGTEFTL